MTEPTLALNGHALHSVTLNVGEVGAWVADCRLTEAPALPAGTAAALSVAGATLVGTIIESQSFGLALGARVVGGAGGWAKSLRRRSYHNDAGIKAQIIIADAAREAGETLGTVTPGVERIGIDYVRREAAAAETLEYAAGGAPWWLDYAGVTHVGARAADTIPADACTVLAYNPTDGLAQLAVNDFAALVPGRTLADARLPSPMRVRDIELVSAKGSPVRATVCCAPLAAGVTVDAGRLPGLMQALLARLTPDAGALFGLYRYRVVTMRGDLRCDLQAVRAELGLPDCQAVAQCPGVPGAAARITEGSEVLVQFIDGDRSAPVITHYAGPGATGFAPTQLVLGDQTGEPAARQGDSVRVLMPPALFTGTIAIGGGAPSPATGVVSWVAPTADGTITGGSGKVRIAT